MGKEVKTILYSAANSCRVHGNLYEEFSGANKVGGRVHGKSRIPWTLHDFAIMRVKMTIWG